MHKYMPNILSYKHILHNIYTKLKKSYISSIVAGSASTQALQKKPFHYTLNIYQAIKSNLAIR